MLAKVTAICKEIKNGSYEPFFYGAGVREYET